jgi:hypothetical protein
MAGGRRPCLLKYGITEHRTVEVQVAVVDALAQAGAKVRKFDVVLGKVKSKKDVFLPDRFSLKLKVYDLSFFWSHQNQASDQARIGSDRYDDNIGFH